MIIKTTTPTENGMIIIESTSTANNFYMLTAYNSDHNKDITLLLSRENLDDLLTNIIEFEPKEPTP